MCVEDIYVSSKSIFHLHRNLYRKAVTPPASSAAAMPDSAACVPKASVIPRGCSNANVIFPAHPLVSREVVVCDFGYTIIHFPNFAPNTGFGPFNMA
jgi:hypothetical protein